MGFGSVLPRPETFCHLAAAIPTELEALCIFLQKKEPGVGAGGSVWPAGELV